MDPKELADKLAKAEKEIVTLKFVAELNDQEKEFFKSLSDSDKESFQKLNAADRVIKMGDKIVKMVKSADLDAVTKKLTDAETELKKAKDDNTAKDAEIAKLKASGEEKDLIVEVNKRFPKSAGTAEEKAKVLKAVKAMPDETARNAVLKSMDDAEKAAVELAKEKGTSKGGDDGSDASAKLDALAKKIATDEKITFEQGFTKAVNTPEGRKLNDEIRKARTAE